jgi:hypothetical protein
MKKVAIVFFGHNSDNNLRVNNSPAFFRAGFAMVSGRELEDVKYNPQKLHQIASETPHILPFPDEKSAHKWAIKKSRSLYGDGTYAPVFNLDTCQKIWPNPAVKFFRN